MTNSCNFKKEEKAPRWDDDPRNEKWCECDACKKELYGEYTLDKWGCRVYKGKKN